MKTTLNYFLIASLAIFLLAGCSKDDDNNLKGNDNSDIDLSHSFTLSEDNTYTFFVDGVEYGGPLRVINSMNNSLYLSVDLMASGNLASIGGLPLPKSEGEFLSGYDFGPGNGTNGNNIYLNVFLKIEGETYYAYSSHAYGFLETERVEGSECKLKITKFTGDYTTYNFWNMTLTSFIGEAHVLFAGTFKTKDGSKTVNIERGQILIREELPDGAELIS